MAAAAQLRGEADEARARLASAPVFGASPKPKQRLLTTFFDISPAKEPEVEPGLMHLRGARGPVNPAFQTVAERERHIKAQAIKEQSRRISSEILAKDTAAAEIRELACRRDELLLLADSHLTKRPAHSALAKPSPPALAEDAQLPQKTTPLPCPPTNTNATPSQDLVALSQHEAALSQHAMEISTLSVVEETPQVSRETQATPPAGEETQEATMPTHVAQSQAQSLLCQLRKRGRPELTDAERALRAETMAKLCYIRWEPSW
jgi:hypothetical protein